MKEGGNVSKIGMLDALNVSITYKSMHIKICLTLCLGMVTLMRIASCSLSLKLFFPYHSHQS